MSLKRQYPFPYKTVANDNSLDVSSISIENITIQSPSTYPTYTLTLPINTGSAGQVLTTNGSGVLSWSAPTAGVTSVTASSPVVSSGGVTPNISLNTIPTTLGGTGLTTVGTNGQVLTSNGTTLSWQSPTGGTVTSVSASVPSWLSVTVTNPTTTPAIAITGSNTGLGTTVVLNDSPFIFTPAIRQYLTLDVLTPYTGPLGRFLREYADPTIEGQNYRYIELGRYASDIMVGSDSSKFFFYRNSNTGNQFSGIRYSDKMFRFNGLANFTLPDSEGTNGQILSTDGTGVTSWINNQVGTVTSVSASVPSWLSVTVTNPTTTPAIAITGSATGTGTVSVLQNSPTINTLLTVSGDVNVNRTSSNGLGISVYNTDNTYPTSSYIAVGRNSSPLNHTHFGTIINGNNDNTNYGYIEFNSNRIELSYAGNVTIPGAIISTNPSGSANIGSFLILRDTTDVYISHYKAGSSGVLDDAFIISTGSASDSTKTYFYGRNGKVGIFNNSPITTFDVIGSIGASSFIKLNNISLYGSSLTTSLYLPTSPGTNGQVLTSAGTGNAMTWTTPTTGTVTSVSATSPLASSGGATPTISISSSTGTGAVMLQSGPSAVDYLGLRSVTPDIYLDLNTNYGQFASLECHNLANVKKPIILNGYGGNVGIGITSPVYKLQINGDGGLLGIDGSTTSYQDIRINGTLATRLGYPYSGDTAFYFVKKNDGPFEFYHDGTSGVQTNFYMPVTTRDFINIHKNGTGVNAEINIFGGNGASTANTASINLGVLGGGGGTIYQTIRAKYNATYGYHTELSGAANFVSSSPIVVENVARIKAAPASSTFDFILPSGPGTAGQYLISGGAGAAMYWGSGGGGGGGTVNSVTASAPLSSSGGTAPNISIASATGTGSVVLQTDPQLLGSPLMASGLGPLLRFTHDVAGGINYIQSGAAFSAGSAQDLNFGPILTADSFMRIKANGNVGIGTTAPSTKLHVQSISGAGEQILADRTNTDGQAGISITAGGAAGFAMGVGGSTWTAGSSTLQNKFYWYFNGGFRLAMDSTGNVGIGTTTPAAKLDVNGAVYSNSESRFSNGTYSDPDSGQSYCAKFGTSSGNGIAVKGNSKFTNSVTAANFTTNSTNFFSYESVTTNFDMAIYYTLDGKCYDLTSPPAGRGAITIAYASSSNTVTYTRIGRLVTIVIGVEYSYVIPAFQSMADCKICLKLPAALAPVGTGSPGSNGSYPSRIDDAFVISYGFKYWLQSVAYNGGGFVPIIMLFRNDNSHDFLQWDNNNKSGQKVYLTMSYLVNSA